MKIIFTGGGTGGHFYPIIAIAEAMLRIKDKEGHSDLKMYYISDDPYDKELLDATQLEYIEIKTGKKRTYSSFKNFTDIFLIIAGSVKALFKIFSLYPDVIFGKGGYASFPSMFAAKMLRVPVMIHESDISLGRVNKWIEPHAEKIAISYPETAVNIPHAETRVAITGIPVRNSILEVPTEDPFSYLGLEKGIKTILVLGGSQGAEQINEHIMDLTPKLIERYQVIHQTGQDNLAWMKKRAEGLIGTNPLYSRYHPYPYLDAKSLRLAGMAADLIISRSGSTIFEIALWGKPSILIPLPIARGDHQRENAYSYARTGACTVIEEANLRNELFFSVIEGLLENDEKRTEMAKATEKFRHTDAADKIAQALYNIGLKHGN